MRVITARELVLTSLVAAVACLTLFSNQASALPATIAAAETCVVKPEGSACWKELANRPGCFFWNPVSGKNETVTWTGECKAGIAQGHGTLTFAWDGGRAADEGTIRKGKQQGRWVLHVSNGNEEVGAYTDGQRTGRWSIRWPDGSVGEGAMVGDDMDGEWVVRLPDGKTETRHYVKGVRAAESKSAPAAAQVCKPSEYATDTYFPKPAFAGQTRAPVASSHVSYKVETVARGLAHPWSLAFLPDGRMLVTEKPGRLRIVSRSGALSAPLEGVPTLAKFPDGDGGIHDVLLDPQFATNRILYFTTYEIAPGQVIEPNKPDQPLKGIGRIMRARLSNDERSLAGLQAIYEGIGGTRRLALAPDGTLLVSTFAIDAAPAQKLDTNESKILRIRTDGAIPQDNPWVGKAGVRPEIYALGIRDAEGLTFDPATGVLWETEHGPRGGDELNVIRPGKNYGYPIISYGREYSGESINNGLTAKPGLEQPVYFWTPDIAPSGLLVYRGDMFPQWKGDLFIGALATQRLVRLQMRNAHVAAEESLLGERCQRIRDVRQGPEGAIYLLTDEDDGQILRLVRGP